MQTYDTVTGALAALKAKGYTLNFNIAFNKLMCSNNEVCLNPNEFEITEVHRFEGDTNPSDEDVVYAIESHNQKIKGTLTSAFGMYADTISTDMLHKISMHK